MMTIDQINVLKQGQRIISSKLEILDENDYVIRELTGFWKKGNYRIRAKNGARRTCDLEMVINSETVPSPSSPIWINRRFRAYVGVRNMRNGEDVWFPVGTFAISDPSQDISVSGENNLSIKGADFTAFLDGTLGGTLNNGYIINAGDYVHNALQNIMNDIANFNTNIQETSFKIPFKIEKDAQDDAWDLLKEILELYLHYEGFFDVWGTFVYQKTSDLITDSVVWDFSVPENNFIESATITYGWNDVRNRIIVHGRDKDGVYPSYTTAAVSSNPVWADCPYTVDRLGESKCFSYKMPQDMIDKLWEKVQAATTAEEDKDLLNIKNLATENKWDKNTAIENTVGEEVRAYLLGTMKASDLGVRFKAYKLEEEFKKYIASKEIADYYYNPRTMTIQVNDYYKVEQCITRAQYELDTRLSGSEKVRLTILPIYGLDVNQLIFLDLRVNNTPVVGKYCIDEISCEFGEKAMMDVTCHKVTKARYSFDQELLHEKDPDSWQYGDKVEEDKDGNVEKPKPDEKPPEPEKPKPQPPTVINNILHTNIVDRYKLTIAEQKDIQDLITVTKTVAHKFEIIKSEYDVKLFLRGTELHRDNNKNWFTDSHAIGQDLTKNGAWVGTASPLPSYWTANNVNFRIYPQTLTAIDTYIPSCFIDAFNLTEDEAKEIAWVGLCYGKRTNKKGNFGANVAKNYLEARITNNGPVLNIMETYGSYTKLYRDANKNWYSDKYAYGQCIFKDKGWVGTASSKPKYGFNEESNGMLRLDYENTMAGKNDLLS